MRPEEFSKIRKRMKKTQKEMAQLLGVSVKAIHSYEQGWRSIPAHVERQVLFLISRSREDLKECWSLVECPDERKEKCPAWEFKAGKLCWFINGTICEGKTYKNWDEKMALCRTCEVLQLIL